MTDLVSCWISHEGTNLTGRLCQLSRHRGAKLVLKTESKPSCGRKAKTPRHLAMLSVLCVSCAPKVENLHQSTSLVDNKDSLQWRKANQNPRLSAMLSSPSVVSTLQVHQRQVSQQQQLETPNRGVDSAARFATSKWFESSSPQIHT